MIDNMSWLEDKKKITDTYFTAINLNNLELYRVIKDKYTEIQPIYPLLQFILDRLETVTVLTTSNKLWDAEIILRSALETFIKFLFITSSESQEREKLLDEYWNLLTEVNTIKHSDQAKINLKHFGHLETYKLAFSPILLSDEQESRLRAKWPKTERKKLEQKWSFTEIVSSLSKNYRGKPFELLSTLSQSYRISSHISHGDEFGVMIISERKERTQDEQNTANFAHYIRLLSDTNVFCAFAGIETMNYLKINNSFFFKNQDLLKEIEPLNEKYLKDLYNDPFYDKFREEQKNKT